MKDNYRVDVVICPVCDEPVVADVPLMSTDPNAGVLIRHHVQRQSLVHRKHGRTTWEEHVYCSGSKTVVAGTGAVDLSRLAPTAKQPDADVRVELHKNGTATVNDRTK